MKNGNCANISFKQALLIKKAIWIDVRDKDEYNIWHFENSLNIPVYEIDKVSSIVKNKKRSIIVYCSKGIRSIAACQILSKMGYTKVYNLKDGIDW